MGYHQQRTLARQQLLLQPGNSGVIHMVGRLVQNQQVRRTHQHTGQGHTLALAAAQLAHLLLQISNAKLRKHCLRFAFQLPGIFIIHLLLQIKQMLLQLFVIRLRCSLLHRSFVITQQHHQRRIAFKNLLQYSCICLKRRVLRQIFHHHTAGNCQLAVTGLMIGNHAQQGTFTGAINTDNTILVTLFYVKCNIFKQQSVAIAVRKILCT